MAWIFISGQQRYLLLENVYMQTIQNNKYYLLEFLLTQSSSPSYLGGLGLFFVVVVVLIEFHRKPEVKGSNGLL